MRSRGWGGFMMNRAAADVQHRVEAAERARLEARHAITCADALAGTTAPELRATLLSGDPESKSLENEQVVAFSGCRDGRDLLQPAAHAAFCTNQVRKSSLTPSHLSFRATNHRAVGVCECFERRHHRPAAGRKRLSRPQLQGREELRPLNLRSNPEQLLPRLRNSMLPTHRPPTHPGEMLLKEFLEPLGVSQVEAATRMSIPFQRLNGIVKGRRAVSADTALLLDALTGWDAQIWLTLQAKWDLWHALKARGRRPKVRPLRKTA
jgi:addiction module HigA family antidote